MQKRKNKNLLFKQYPFFVNYDSEDKVFVVHSIDLKGCHSDGKTPEQALENFQEAVDGWLETAKKNKIKIPSPSINQKSKKLSFEIDSLNLKKLKKLTATSHKNLNSLVNMAIAAY